jgi:hypothetical protein
MRPNDLFAICMAKQQKLANINVRDQVRQALKDTLFIRHPLFMTVLNRRSEQFYVKAANERYPFDISIIRRKDAQISEPEWRYGQILEHLKKLPTTELRLLFIARWLKQEGVCEPEDIMPSALLGRVLAQFLQKDRISVQDFRHWYLVEIWLPYFDRLFAHLQKAPKTNRGLAEELVKQGYDDAAVKAAIGKRSPIPAIASWLEDSHKGLEARTLENAYSRVKVGRQKRRSVPA